MNRFVDVTESAGQRVSLEQLDRAWHRYRWAAREIAGRDTLEIACGSGHGLGILKTTARSLAAGDISAELCDVARRTFGNDVEITQIDALHTEFADASFDCVILFEALYYLPDATKFFAEVKRLLRPHGLLLMTTANKDLYDFTPSPYSTRYLGAQELTEEMERLGFAVELAGYHSTGNVSPRQKVLRPVKAAVSSLGLVPRTMAGKEWMKRIFFGKLVDMPSRLDRVDNDFAYRPPQPIDCGRPNHNYKIIYCRAALNGEGANP